MEWSPSAAGLVLESSVRLGDAWTALLANAVALTTNGPTVRAVDLRPAAESRFYRLREVNPVGPVGGLAYDIGNPVWRDLYVDPVNGNDDNPGTSRTTAFGSIQTAFWSLPEGTQTRATRIRLMPGTHAGAFL